MKIETTIDLTKKEKEDVSDLILNKPIEEDSFDAKLRQFEATETDDIKRLSQKQEMIPDAPEKLEKEKDPVYDFLLKVKDKEIGDEELKQRANPKCNKCYGRGHKGHQLVGEDKIPVVCKCVIKSVKKEAEDAEPKEKSFSFDESIIMPGDPTATPKRIEDYKEYYPVKYKICKEQNPKKMIEIGVRAGYSAWTFLHACPKMEYIGIDANNGTHGGQGGEDGKFMEWAEKILDPYNAIIVEMDTQKMDTLEFKDIDFIHVDGDHSEKGVQHDLDLAWEAIRVGGLILIDDVTYLDSVRNGIEKWLYKKIGKSVIIKYEKDWFIHEGKNLKFKFMKSLRGELLIYKK